MAPSASQKRQKHQQKQKPSRRPCTMTMAFWLLFAAAFSMFFNIITLRLVKTKDFQTEMSMEQYLQRFVVPKSDISDKSEPVEEKDSGHDHAIAGLSCERFGGPSQEDLEEIIYWEDIPSDALYKSPFYDENKYVVSFEEDLSIQLYGINLFIANL